jgi:hypothetical protein
MIKYSINKELIVLAVAKQLITQNLRRNKIRKLCGLEN